MSKAERGQGYKAKIRLWLEGPARGLDKLTGGRLTPNMVSILTVILHLPIAWLIINCYLGYGGLALALVAPLDLLDGALARVQKRTSDFGTILDAVGDRVKEIIIFSAIAYHLAASGSQLTLAVCVLAVGFSVLVSYVKAKGEMAVATKSKSQTAASLNRRFEIGLMGYELRVVVLVISLITSQLVIGLWVIAVGALLTAGSRLLKFKQVV